MRFTNKTLTSNRERHHNLKPIQVEKTPCLGKGISEFHYTSSHQTTAESL